MRNPCLDIALRALDAAGIREVERVHGGKHIQLRWRVNGHELRVYSMPATPSDWRAVHNTRAGIRRLLREDGVLAASEHPEPAARKPDRVAALEQRVAALEDFVRTLQTGGQHG